ncbi:MAG: glycyl-radical enzyme activating protein [Lachnospiraceae bacterium]|nr:glycyl-radical enzyme activating protein [Lachnospiraceae bacterium]
MDEAALRNVSGTIFNIQHYSIHDGPGIRTNVFLKGCPLRCLWCSNPESQQQVPQLMFRADRCTGCGACISSCPVSAISLVDQRVQNDRSLCTGCGACVAVCPNEAREIIGTTATAGEVFDEVAQDELFYAKDGGVTLTGGEVLVQPAFASAVLQLCRQAKIHTAIETCGFADWAALKEVLQYTDLVLYDLKEMDPELHKKYTGVDNSRILENLKKIDDQMDLEIWVRVPLIPGCNDDKENLLATARFVKENLHKCTQIHLLPFHRLGEGKYEQLENEPNGFSSTVPDDSYMESLRDYVKSFGLDCR